MGSLRLEVSTDGGSSWNSIWSRAGDVGDDNWYPVNVDLNSYGGQIIKLRFYAKTGTSFRSDMAIDDLWLTVGTGQVSGTIAGHVGFPIIGKCSDALYYACCNYDISNNHVQNVGFDIRDANTGTILTSSVSNASGNYLDTISDGNISISPYVDATAYNNGVSITDVIVINKHIQDIQYLDCPVQRIAADVDNDGDIDVADKDTINQIVLGTITSFSAPNWRFISKAYYFPSDMHPDARFLADFWNRAKEDTGGQDYPFKANLRIADKNYEYIGSDKWLQKTECLDI
ncbi:MAG: hypothetical protein IPJ74_08605 [Saprospiraceae bacterium]|nr:hypothetical protein [Saprospiraceae bacterium]